MNEFLLGSQDAFTYGGRTGRFQIISYYVHNKLLCPHNNLLCPHNNLLSR